MPTAGFQLRSFAALGCVLLTGGFHVSRAQQPGPPPRHTLQQQLQSKFEELHKGASFPGGTAGFVLADGSSFAIAVGVSDRTAKTPMKTTDRLLLGSVGKTYVSAVALQMIHEKKFSLDDTLDKFFGTTPWFPRLANASKITVRHLMTHTSGIVRYELNPRFTRDLKGFFSNTGSFRLKPEATDSGVQTPVSSGLSRKPRIQL